ncbi:unnamed protein product, partial [Ixodes hexagonus]
PRVYFDIEADRTPLGRIVMQLRPDVVPKTAENFRMLCTHERGFGYLYSRFHRIIPSFMCQGGDITNHDGTGGYSVYGASFDDENFHLRHGDFGALSMASTGRNTNRSQFFITTGESEWLDGRHVVFGRVIDGFEIVRKMEALGTPSGEPLMRIVIAGCGQLL